MSKKILVVDDSALMRRVLCDIINSDRRFEVAAQASNGVEAFELLKNNKYDAVILDIYMPKMNGIELLEELHKYHISARVLIVSTYAREGAQITLDALELGALDFVHKPENAMAFHEDDFKNELLRVLEAAVSSDMPVFEPRVRIRQEHKQESVKRSDIAQKYAVNARSKEIVAIASSTGGPKALHSVILKLPADLNAPVLVVQHMPKGFTASLAERLNTLGHIRVKEAEEGEELKNGVVYFARGGSHMNIRRAAGGCVVAYSDEPPREGVKPCANYMYESLADCPYERVVCVVMTGMGADGTEGIQRLKEKKKVYVISQDEASCTVYGMPKSVAQAGLSDKVVTLEEIAQEVVAQVGHSPQQR
ncbi:MAG: chemotaxis response regulator protein-glutamate methylesterase [Lachnospiraceae bacterium]|nr:chemotaxis response regulator protein-glutamate methylesterase [Lachnospiraceae bacterium]